MNTNETITIEVPRHIIVRNVAKAGGDDFSIDLNPLVSAGQMHGVLCFAFGRKISDRVGAKAIDTPAKARAEIAKLQAAWHGGSFDTGGRSVPLWIEILRELADAKKLLPATTSAAKAIPAGATDADIATVFGQDKVKPIMEWAMAEAKRREAIADVDLDDLLS